MTIGELGVANGYKSSEEVTSVVVDQPRQPLTNLPTQAPLASTKTFYSTRNIRKPSRYAR